MKIFKINNNSFEISVETPPLGEYKPKYIINKAKVKEMIERNGGEIVWRYIPNFDNNYILGCDGELWRYDKRQKDWVKVKFTQLKDNLQTKLLDSNKKRHTKKLTLLMKETFPELITYDKLLIQEVENESQNEIINQQIKNSALIKCYDSSNNITTYYTTIAQASKRTNVDEKVIRQNLAREIHSVGGLTFYYN